MDASAWKALRAAIEELHDSAPSDRHRAVDRIARGDESLRAELLRILATWDNELELEAPPAIVVTPASDLGRRIGAWVLEREIGVGGMGQVFRARRVDGGFEQRAALKLIRRGLDTHKLLHRFQRERALLARLAHPGIAQLHDGGATDDGLPWFAMELVEGQPIDRWCAERGSDARARIELFLHVAAAVQHAHAHMIVHRDIKPSNILVDEHGAPKLLDFGIAKALGEEDDDLALTRTGERVLTPLYASPEQWRGEPATAASDVYALGGVLYELLAGATPRSRDELTSLERVEHWPPPERPSTRGVRQTDTTRVGVDTRAMANAVAGDLDLIVLRSLHTDPSRRYPTVERLAADLRCWLDGLPIEARADSLTYRVRQFVRRNRLAVASATIVIVGLSIGLFVAIAGWRDSMRANQRAHVETSKLLQLAARQDLQDLEDEAQSLWPISPELLPRLDSWIARARRLSDDAPKHRATLADLESGPTESHVSEQEKHWWRRQIEMHLADLAAFTDPEKGLFTDAVNAAGIGIPRRARLIRRALELSDDPDVRRAWDETNAHARTSPAYQGCDVPALFGLVPLGPDPSSGLLEFFDARTGEAPRRDPEQGIQLGPEHALVFVLVPPALVTIGAQVTDPAAPYYDANASANAETPPWRVQLAPFLISKFELTQAQWARMEGHNPSSNTDKEANGEDLSGTRPVEMVSWDDCLRLLQHFMMMLPSGAQWEEAARGNTSTPWWCGSRAALESSENLYDQDGRAIQRHAYEPESWHDGGGRSMPVGRYKANPFGLHDTLGNVSEWCLDFSASWSLEPQPGRGLRNAPDNLSREVRGGSYAVPAPKSRASSRISSPLGRRSDVVGVRPVRLFVEDGPR